MTKYSIRNIARKAVLVIAALALTTSCRLPDNPSTRDYSCDHWGEWTSPIAFGELVSTSGRVSDHAMILSEQTEKLLEEKFQELEQKLGHQLVVVTVKSLGGIDVADYTRALSNAWKVGRAEYNDGVVLLVAPVEKKTRIAVGCGLESVLTDEIAKDIIQTDILPFFRIGEFDTGVIEGADQIADVLYRKSDLPRPNQPL